MMTSNRPYLLRAMNAWILDNHLTPHILVDTSVFGVLVPGEYVEGNKIVLNISPGATRDLLINDEQVRFSARFNGKATFIEVPMSAVVGIYARENGQGMIFPEEHLEQEAAEQAFVPSQQSEKPRLRLVKGGKEEKEQEGKRSPKTVRAGIDK